MLETNLGLLFISGALAMYAGMHAADAPLLYESVAAFGAGAALSHWYFPVRAKRRG